MAYGVGDASFPQLELWPRPHRSEDLTLRYLDLDGSENELDPDRLAHTIQSAGAVGDSLDWDTAVSLARASVAFLRHSSEPEPFPHVVVVQTIERALREMGLGRTARLYARHYGQILQPIPEQTPERTRWDSLLDAPAVARHVNAWLQRAQLDDATCEEIENVIQLTIDKSTLDLFTPGLAREWVLSELLRRGLNKAAERIASVPVSIADLESFHRGESEHAHAAPAEPALRAYAFARVYPKRVAEACDRGDLRLGPFASFPRLQRIALDLEGAKSTLPEDANDESPLVDPTRLARRITVWTRTLSPLFTDAIAWRGVNFGYAPLLDELDTPDRVRAAYALFFETARSESSPAAPGTELEFCWDAPESLGSIAHRGDGTPIPVNDLYPTARDFFAASLDALTGLAERPTSVRFPRVVLRLSPYFFGSPQAPEMLDRIARIIAADFPLELRHDPAAPLALDIGAISPAVQIIAQTATVDVHAIVHRSANSNAVLAAMERAADDAAAAHAARHDHIVELARHRAGLLAPLRERYADAPLLTPNSLQYRTAIDWDGAPQTDEDAISAALDRVRLTCERWSESTGRRIDLVELKAMNAARLDPNSIILAQSRFHAQYAEPAPICVHRDASLSAPANIAEFIRWAFLYTPCRALRFH